MVVLDEAGLGSNHAKATSIKGGDTRVITILRVRKSLGTVEKVSLILTGEANFQNVTKHNRRPGVRHLQPRSSPC